MTFKDKDKKKKRQKEAFDYFVSKGYTPVQAAGIIGNLMQESQFNIEATSTMPGESSYGLAQWNPGKGDKSRFHDLKRFAKQKGTDISDFRTQLEFITHELDTKRFLGKKDLLKAKTIEEAALVVSNKYERPHKDHAANNKRINYGIEAYREFAGDYAYIRDENNNLVTPPASEVPQSQRGRAANYKVYDSYFEKEGDSSSVKVLPEPTEQEMVTVQQLEDTSNEVKFKDYLTEQMQKYKGAGDLQVPNYEQEAPKKVQPQSRPLQVPENEYFNMMFEPKYEEGGTVESECGGPGQPPCDEKKLNKKESDSLTLYKAYIFQKQNSKPAYNRWLKEMGENYPGGTEALKEARNKNIGVYGQKIKHESNNDPYYINKDWQYDPPYEEDYKIINKYKELTKEDPDFRIAVHNSPDLWHKDIQPIGTYFDGSYSPVYKKPSFLKEKNSLPKPYIQPRNIGKPLELNYEGLHGFEKLPTSSLEKLPQRAIKNWDIEQSVNQNLGGHKKNFKVHSLKELERLKRKQTIDEQSKTGNQNTLRITPNYYKDGGLISSSNNLSESENNFLKELLQTQNFNKLSQI